MNHWLNNCTNWQIVKLLRRFVESSYKSNDISFRFTSLHCTLTPLHSTPSIQSELSTFSWIHVHQSQSSVLYSRYSFLRIGEKRIWQMPREMSFVWISFLKWIVRLVCEVIIAYCCLFDVLMSTSQMVQWPALSFALLQLLIIEVIIIDSWIAKNDSLTVQRRNLLRGEERRSTCYIMLDGHIDESKKRSIARALLPLWASTVWPINVH